MHGLFKRGEYFPIVLDSLDIAFLYLLFKEVPCYEVASFRGID